jgi:hypothetical protein
MRASGLRLKCKWIFSLALLLSFVGGWFIDGQAQSTHMMSKNLGLGGGGTAYMDGYHANFINPANLSVNNGRAPNMTVGLAGTGFSAGGPLVNISLYNQYMTGGQVLNDVADEMYSSWFGPDFSRTKSMGAVVNSVPLGMAYRMNDWTFSLAVRARSLTNLSVNRGAMEFFTYLFDEGKFGEPEPVNFELSLLNVSEYSIGVSKKIYEGRVGESLPVIGGLPVKVHAGVAPKLLIGHNSMRLDFDSQVQVTDDYILHDFEYTINTAGQVTRQLRKYHQDVHVREQDGSFSDYISSSNVKPMSARATGLGLDLGFTAEFDLSSVEQLDLNVGNAFEGRKFARIGISLTDLGKVNMSSDVGSFTNNDQFKWSGFEYMLDEERLNSEFDSSRSEYVDHVTDSIANNIYLNYSPENVSQLSQSLPTMLHIGTQLQLGRAGLMIDVAQGLADRGMTSMSTMAAFGLEYKFFGVWPLRLGMRTGGRGSTSFSVGTGVDFKNFEFSISAMNVNNSASNGSYAAVAVSGLVFHF